MHIYAFTVLDSASLPEGAHKANIKVYAVLLLMGSFHKDLLPNFFSLVTEFK
jgi:hypothetical protein